MIPVLISFEVELYISIIILESIFCVVFLFDLCLEIKRFVMTLKKIRSISKVDVIHNEDNLDSIF